MKVTNNQTKFFFSCPVQPKKVEVTSSFVVLYFVYDESLYKKIRYTQTNNITVTSNIITGKEYFYVIRINHHGNKLMIDLVNN